MPNENQSPRRNWGMLPANQVLLARLLSFSLAGIWLLFGGLFLFRSQDSMPLPPGWSIVIGLLMFGNAAAFAWAGFGLGKRRRVYFYFALLLVAANLLLTFTDEVGLFDIATLVLLIIILAVLLWSRKIYVGRRPT